MLDRLRQSLALRLTLQYALVFAASAALLFGALYWWLAGALEERDQRGVEERAAEFAAAYAQGGAPMLTALVRGDDSPEMRSLFVRLISPAKVAVFVVAPPDWIETEVRRLPVPEWAGMVAEERRQTVRVPQDALRDYTIATLLLRDGWVLQVGRLTDSRSVVLAPLRRGFAGAGAVALFFSLGFGTILAWRTTRPLRAVADTTRRILDTGDLGARVPAPAGTGELAVLVRQLNTLLDKNATHVRVLRETHDNLAHDLRTPLTRLRGTAELALQDTGSREEALAALADCVEESDRLLHMLETLLDISSAESGTLRLERKPCDLRTMLLRAQDLYLEVAQEKQIEVTVEAGDPVSAEADAVHLGQALNNLVDNAIKYTPQGGKVRLSARLEHGRAIVDICDTGPGVPSSEREAIFRRLYRSDSSRTLRGFGLGLSLVKAIIEAHGGAVKVDEAPGGGARFRVELPLKT